MAFRLVDYSSLGERFQKPGLGHTWGILGAPMGWDSHYWHQVHNNLTTFNDGVDLRTAQFNRDKHTARVCSWLSTK